jgi:hypothetical protein
MARENMFEKMGSWQKIAAGVVLGLATNEVAARADTEAPHSPVATLDTPAEARSEQDEAPKPTKEQTAKKIIDDAIDNGYIKPGTFNNPQLDKDGFMVGGAAPTLTPEQEAAIEPLRKYQHETCLMIPQGTIDSMDTVSRQIIIKTFNGQKIIYEPKDPSFFTLFKPGEKIGYKIVYRGNKARPVEYICHLPFPTQTAAENPEATLARNKPSAVVEYILLPKQSDATKPGDTKAWLLHRLDGSQPTIPPLRLSTSMINQLDEKSARRNPGYHHNHVIPPLIDAVR